MEVHEIRVVIIALEETLGELEYQRLFIYLFICLFIY